MRRIAAPLLPTLLLAMLVASTGGSARGQLIDRFRDNVNLRLVNRLTAGTIVDYTHNHDEDRRIFSPALGMPRDLYVYLPPGYTPTRSYPLILYFHMGYVDEHTFLSRQILQLDKMIRKGQIPPVIVAAPDGTYTGENATDAPHSLYVNGLGGRVEDHIMGEVIPFLLSRYAIRPERQAHAILGMSAGGFGAMSLAIRHRDFFGAVATLAAPLNMRYNSAGPRHYREDFDPVTYRWATRYDPDQTVGVFYGGLSQVPASKYIRPVFGDGPGVVSRIAAVNPADLLFTSGIRPGELAMYVNYPARDNYNFDAQAESFAWLARGQGLAVDLERSKHPSRHNLVYFDTNHRPAYRWLGQHILPPTP